MTTQFVEDVDTDIFTVLDFDYEVPCEAVFKRTNTGCDQAAEWRVIFSCCGRIVLFCDKHFNMILKDVGRVAFRDSVDTGGCGRDDIVQPFSFTEKISK